MTSLAIRFASAREAQADAPKLKRLRLWAKAVESVSGLRPGEDEIARRISRLWPELAPHRRRWLRENL